MNLKQMQCTPRSASIIWIWGGPISLDSFYAGIMMCLAIRTLRDWRMKNCNPLNYSFQVTDTDLDCHTAMINSGTASSQSTSSQLTIQSIEQPTQKATKQPTRIDTLLRLLSRVEQTTSGKHSRKKTCWYAGLADMSLTFWVISYFLGSK